MKSEGLESLIGSLVDFRCLWGQSTEEGSSACNAEERLALQGHLCEYSAMEVLNL